MNLFYIHSGCQYPPDKHLLDGLKECGHDVIELIENRQGFARYYRFAKLFQKNKKGYDAVIIGYGLPLFVPILRILFRGKIIFNAVSSQYEANIVSRGTSKAYSLTALKWWTIDFVSFHLPSKTLLESNAQINFVRKFFLVSQKKLVRSWTGVNEKEFYHDPSIKKRDVFTVLFRGRFLPESGVLTVIEAAKKLEESAIQFRIIGTGFMYREVDALIKKLSPKNIEMIPQILPADELREKMLACHISLGQLADHPRLLRTLPCKLFESLALGLPYLTARNPGVLELLAENETCFAVEPGNASDLAQKIIFLKNNPKILEEVAARGHQHFKETLTSKQLAKEVIRKCF